MICHLWLLFRCSRLGMKSWCEPRDGEPRKHARVEHGEEVGDHMEDLDEES